MAVVDEDLCAPTDEEDTWWEELGEEDMAAERDALETEAREFAENFVSGGNVSFDGAQIEVEQQGLEEEAGGTSQPDSAAKRTGRKRIDRRSGRPKDSSIPLEQLPKVSTSCYKDLPSASEFFQGL